MKVSNQIRPPPPSPYPNLLLGPHGFLIALIIETWTALISNIYLNLWSGKFEWMEMKFNFKVREAKMLIRLKVHEDGVKHANFQE